MMRNLPHKEAPCKDCPFRIDCMKGWLDRMPEILEGDTFVCHKNNDLQCAGHMLIKGRANAFVKLAGRLRIDLPLKGRHLVFETEQECIAHHEAKP